MFRDLRLKCSRHFEFRESRSRVRAEHRGLKRGRALKSIITIPGNVSRCVCRKCFPRTKSISLWEMQFRRDGSLEQGKTNSTGVFRVQIELIIEKSLSLYIYRHIYTHMQI